MATRVPKRIQETKTLSAILPAKSASSGREFARIVNLLLFHDGRRNGRTVTLFDDRLVIVISGYDSTLCISHSRNPFTPCYAVLLLMNLRHNRACLQKNRFKPQLKRFGANLRKERIAAGMTQEKLAERTEFNIRTVQKIEAGQANILITTAARLRRALGCPRERLIK